MWGGGRFLALARNTIYHSTDGVTWTRASAPATEERLNDVTWGGGRFVAVGARGTIVHSADGDRWTAASDTAVSDEGGLVAVASNGTHFVAVGNDGSGAIVHSADGDRWTAASDTGVTNWFFDVTWAGTHFVAIGLDRDEAGNNRLSRIVRSEDGNTWVKASELSDFLGNPAHGNGRLVAIRNGVLMYSPADGTTWTEVTPAPTAQELQAVAWNGTRFVAVGQNGTIVTSP